ncbi:NaeI family type II restriction endonuclease [Streptomyces sp. NPDC048340]|uniref:NaeI family type II restriction endonuclease n=1 Tax=Streptomyces sp. NPDC048340 TaxID=3365537 RepID=UPI003715CE3B
MPADDMLFSGFENEDDAELDRVVSWFRYQPDLERRFSGILRQSIDEVLDGQRTGRFDVEELAKTEKTYLGTKVEIICQAEFGFRRGIRMDYRVADVDVDAKFSLAGQWMIPREAMGHICLLMSASESKSTYRVGLVRITEEILTSGGNQDGKRGISRQGRSAIRWLFEDGVLRENILLKLSGSDRARIMAEPAGQNRVDALFLNVQGRIVDRNAVVTAGKQLDAPKRVRDARKRLQGQGVVILGAQNDSPRIARTLGLPVPEKGTWLALTLAQAESFDEGPRVDIDGIDYVRVEQGEARGPAPEVYC